MRARSIPVGAAIVLALLLGGCTAAGSSTSSDAGVVAPEMGAEPAPAVVDGDTGSRQVVSQGTVSITAEEPVDAAAQAVRLVETAGGRVDSRVLNPGDEASDAFDQPSATLVVRIPAAALTSTLEDLYALGEVEQVELSETDVTSQSTDLDARISALTTSTSRLSALLATAGSTKDLLDIETTLSQRQSDLDALEAQRASLAEQVALASVSLYIGSVESTPADTPDTFLSGLITGFQALVGFGSVLLVALGVALPWLVVLGVIGAVVLVILRRHRRRLPPVSAAETTMDA